MSNYREYCDEKNLQYRIIWAIVITMFRKKETNNKRGGY